MEPVSVPRVLRVERPETRLRPEPDDTRLVAESRSSHVEWTRNAGACVTPFNLQHSFSLLRDGVGARSTKPLAHYAAHTRVVQKEASTTASDRGAFTNGEAPRYDVKPVARPAPRAWALPGR